MRKRLTGSRTWCGVCVFGLPVQRFRGQGRVEDGRVEGVTDESVTVIAGARGKARLVVRMETVDG